MKKLVGMPVAKYIALEELPFRHVESEGFRQLIHAFLPNFDPPSRATVARDICELNLDKGKTEKCSEE